MESYQTVFWNLSHMCEIVATILRVGIKRAPPPRRWSSSLYLAVVNSPLINLWPIPVRGRQFPEQVGTHISNRLRYIAMVRTIVLIKFGRDGRGFGTRNRIFQIRVRKMALRVLAGQYSKSYLVLVQNAD